MAADSVVGDKKLCCKCGRDVAHAPRMKDHDGHYWCVPCGEADRRHQFHNNSGICEGCGESFGRSQLMEITGLSLCPACRKKRFAHGVPGERTGLLGSLKSLLGKR